MTKFSPLLFLLLLLPQISGAAAKISPTHCEVMLSAQSLRIAHGPYQEQINELLDTFKAASFRLTWNDRKQIWNELSKTLKPDELPVVAPALEPPVSVLMFSSARDQDPNRGKLFNAVHFKIEPMKRPGGRTVFNVSKKLQFFNSSDFLLYEKLQVLEIYVGLSLVPYAQYFVVKVDTALDSADPSEDPSDKVALFHRIHDLRAQGLRGGELIEKLDLRETRFMRESFPFPFAGAQVSAWVKGDQAEPDRPEDGEYSIDLYYTLPSYIQWHMDHGSTEMKKIAEIVKQFEL